MNTRIIRRSFNMVEIALAMAIIAIGLSSILVLFPVGINANKAATADNNLTDVAEYMISYMRAGCASEWRKRADTGTTDPFFSQDLADSLANVKGGEKAYSDDPNSTEFKSSWGAHGSNNAGTRLYVCKESGSHGVFLFRQVSMIKDQDGTTDIEIPDFSAVIKIWKDDFDFYVPYAYSSDAIPYRKLSNAGANVDWSTLKNHLENNYGKALCLEMSWPAEVPYANREKRVFRFEIFNESYERSQTTP